MVNRAVMPEHRRQGIASRLVESAIVTARQSGLHTLSMESRPGDSGISAASSVQTYVKPGFQRAGTSARGNTLLQRSVGPRPPTTAPIAASPKAGAITVLPPRAPGRNVAAPSFVLQRGTLQRMDDGSSRYPSRERRSPWEAEEARKEKIEAERKEFQARQAEQERLAEIARKQRLSLPPAQHEGRTFLDEYAINIHGAYDWQGKSSQATTAVGLLSNDTTGRARYQVAPQRAMNDMKDYAETSYGEILTANHFTSSTPPSSNIHAEMWLLYWATARGYTLKRIGVSKKICPNCQYVLNKAKVAYDPGWADDVVRDWKDPWEYYGQKNPFC